MIYWHPQSVHFYQDVQIREQQSPMNKVYLKGYNFTDFELKYLSEVVILHENPVENVTDGCR